MLDKLNARLDQVGQIANMELLLVVGTAKSGTTWVQRMLDTHPEIYCPGEGKFTPLIRGFTKTVSEYNKELTNTNRVVYPNGAYYRTWDETDITTAFQFMAALCWAKSNHKDFSRVRYIGDKDTRYHNSEMIAAWRDHLFKGAKIVHVIRDGRDSVISLVHHMKRTNSTPIEIGSDEFEKILVDYAKVWAENIRRTRKAFRDRPQLYHEVRYEDLLDEPERRLNAILAFLDVERAPDLVQRIVTENTFLKLSGGRKPGAEDRDSFYRKGVAGEWEKTLSPRARQIFSDSSGDILKVLGYKTN